MATQYVRRLRIEEAEWHVDAAWDKQRNNGSRAWWTITVTTPDGTVHTQLVFARSLFVLLFLARLRFDPPISGVALLHRLEQMTGD